MVPTSLISSRTNPAVKNIAALQRRKGRQEAGLFWAEGCICVAAALSSGQPISHIVVSSEAQQSALELAGRAEAVKIQVLRVSPECFEKCSALRHPEGIGAVLPLLPLQTLPEALDEPVMVLWHLQDPGNQGSIIRSCLAMGCRAIVCVEPGVDVFHPLCVRGTAGALFRARLSASGEDDVLAWLRQHSEAVAALSGDGLYSLKAFDGRTTRIIIAGNEPHGLPDTVRSAFATLAIAMSNDIESLNVTAAAAIALHSLWGETPHPEK